MPHPLSPPVAQQKLFEENVKYTQPLLNLNWYDITGSYVVTSQVIIYTGQ